MKFTSLKDVHDYIFNHDNNQIKPFEEPKGMDIDMHVGATSIYTLKGRIKPDFPVVCIYGIPVNGSSDTNVGVDPTEYWDILEDTREIVYSIENGYDGFELKEYSVVKLVDDDGDIHTCFFEAWSELPKGPNFGMTKTTELGKKDSYWWVGLD